MNTKGLAEAEWRKVSDCAEEVRKIRVRFSSLLQVIQAVATKESHRIPGLQVDIDSPSETAEVRSFAGKSIVRLGWDSCGLALEGVGIVSSKIGSEEKDIEILKITIPHHSSIFFSLDGERRIQQEPHDSGRFAYEVLMNIVRKQVDLSA